MDVVWGNPAGWWALAGLPAILAVHFLQRHTRRVAASTLFLLDHVGPESRSGRRLDRLRRSPQLWLQLAAVLVLTWLLLQPRWIRSDSVQRVVVVLDSSASMTAFLDRLPGALAEGLAALAAAARTTEWQVHGSHPGAPVVYRGTRLDELVDRVSAWRPDRGRHPFGTALTAARATAGRDGTVVLVTDHPSEAEGFDVDRLGVGRPVNNWGFSGLRIVDDGPPRWRAVVRNYGNIPGSRSWRLEVAGQVAETGVIQLDPGQSHTVEGGFPAEGGSVWCVLEGDPFPLDDRLPILRPRPKILRLALDRRLAPDEWMEQWAGMLAPVEIVSRVDDPDLLWAIYRPGAVSDTGSNRISFPAPGSAASEPRAAGPIVAADHPLTRELSWQGLLCRPLPMGPLTDADRPLLWLNATPIAMVRSDGPFRQLVIGFDVAASNAERIPAFVLLIHRFAESVRARTLSLERRNVELGEVLHLPADPSGPDLVMEVQGEAPRGVPAREAGLLRAPARPGFFRVRQGEAALLEGAAHFADVREASLADAASFNQLRDRIRSILRRHSDPDPLTWLWTLVLIGLVAGSWAVAKP